MASGIVILSGLWQGADGRESGIWVTENGPRPPPTTPSGQPARLQLKRENKTKKTSIPRLFYLDSHFDIEASLIGIIGRVKAVVVYCGESGKLLVGVAWSCYQNPIFARQLLSF